MPLALPSMPSLPSSGSGSNRPSWRRGSSGDYESPLARMTAQSLRQSNATGRWCVSEPKPPMVEALVVVDKAERKALRRKKRDAWLETKVQQVVSSSLRDVDLKRHVFKTDEELTAEG